MNIKKIYNTAIEKVEVAFAKREYLILKRVAKEDTYTIGRLFKKRGFKKEYLFDTIEAAEGFIVPCGKYPIRFAPVMDGEHGTDYGIVPYIEHGNTQVVIRNGRFAMQNVIVVGDNRAEGRVIHSRKYFNKLMDDILMPSLLKNTYVVLKIKG